MVVEYNWGMYTISSLRLGICKPRLILFDFLKKKLKIKGYAYEEPCSKPDQRFHEFKTLVRT